MALLAQYCEQTVVEGASSQDDVISDDKERSKTFQTIYDRFNTLDSVSSAMKAVGVDSCELILGIDFSAHNATVGKNSFKGKNLHDMAAVNPYHDVICTIGDAIEHIDDDGKIPAFGFGVDDSNKDILYPFKQTANGECDGFEEVDTIYRKIVGDIKQGKSSNFAPVIDTAVGIVKATKKYHILVIASTGQLSTEDKAACIKSIVAASGLPLSIVVIGVGDGPFDTMVNFDNELPQRTFDNFQFVDYNKTKTERNPHAALALAALMEIPDQYQFIKDHGLLEKL